MRTLVRSLLIVALALGVTGATAFAAQSSMPDDALYPVKLFTEDVRLSLTGDPESAFNYLLNLAEERSREVTGMANQGLPVPHEVTTRLQQHFQLALYQAAKMDEPAMIQAMQQIQTMTQSQFQIMEQTRSQTQTQEGGAALDKAQQTMLEAQNAAQGALDDPAIFRTREGVNRPETAPDRPRMNPSKGILRGARVKAQARVQEGRVVRGNPMIRNASSRKAAIRCWRVLPCPTECIITTPISAAAVTDATGKIIKQR